MTLEFRPVAETASIRKWKPGCGNPQESPSPATWGFWSISFQKRPSFYRSWFFYLLWESEEDLGKLFSSSSCISFSGYKLHPSSFKWDPDIVNNPSPRDARVPLCSSTPQPPKSCLRSRSTGSAGIALAESLETHHAPGQQIVLPAVSQSLPMGSPTTQDFLLYLVHASV